MLHALKNHHSLKNKQKTPIKIQLAPIQILFRKFNVVSFSISTLCICRKKKYIKFITFSYYISSLSLKSLARSLFFSIAKLIFTVLKPLLYARRIRKINFSAKNKVIISSSHNRFTSDIGTALL